MMADTFLGSMEKNVIVASPAWFTYELNSCNGHPNKNNILIIPEICSSS
jgi:hypothetical protein